MVAMTMATKLHIPNYTFQMQKYNFHTSVQLCLWWSKTRRVFACILLPWKRQLYWCTASIAFHCAPNGCNVKLLLCCDLSDLSKSQYLVMQPWQDSFLHTSIYLGRKCLDLIYFSVNVYPRPLWLGPKCQPHHFGTGKCSV